MGVYTILKANKTIRPFLLKTELFNRENLYENLQQRVIIYPSYGSTRISISLLPNSNRNYIVFNGSKSRVITGKVNVYNYITKSCLNEKYYIIQDMNFISKENEKIENIFVTLLRGPNGIWRVSSIFDQDGLIPRRDITLIKQKIHTIVIEVAKELEKHFPECPTFLLSIGHYEQKWWIKDVEFHFSKSKWSQYQLLTSLKLLPIYLPHTKLFTPSIFFQFIKKNKQVILKPCNGQLGIGIVQVINLGNDVFELYNEGTKLTINGKKEIIEYLETHFLYRQSYIIQDRIKLATINQNVFDFRVMIQRADAKSKWEVTAKIAKVAARNFFVTNVVSSVLNFEEALQKTSIHGILQKKITKEIDTICVAAARELGKLYPRLTRVGVDIGIDQKGKLWFFEANLVPDVNIFKLVDENLYKKIINKDRNYNS